MNILQDKHLNLDRCPHCSIAKPLLNKQWNCVTTDSQGKNQRSWAVYHCSNCGGQILTCGNYVRKDVLIDDIWPKPQIVHSVIPERARNYLSQAISSLHAPAGAVMLTASAIDAMLKTKGYKEGSLYFRIKEAAKNHVITPEMETWAHEIRLDANDQRHADEGAPLPERADAEKSIEFAKALAQFLFVLPARVERGIKKATETEE